MRTVLVCCNLLTHVWHDWSQRKFHSQAPHVCGFQIDFGGNWLLQVQVTKDDVQQMTLKASSPLSLIKKEKNASAIQVPDGVVLRAAKVAHFFGEKALMSNEQLDCSHVCTSYISSLNHSWSFRFQIHQLTAGNISRSTVLRNSWINMSQKMEHERQLDSSISIACAEAKSSDDHSRLRGCKGFGHLAGWKGIGTCTRGRKDDEKWTILQFCKLTTDIYIYNMIICVLHYVCCFRSPTETLHS